MKTCPVCGARCFDDMEVCYGCMHRFDARDTAASAAEAATVFGQCAADVAVRDAACPDDGKEAPGRRTRRAGGKELADGLETTASKASASAGEDADALRPAAASAFSGGGSPSAANPSFGTALANAASSVPGGGQSATLSAASPEQPVRQFPQGMSVASPPFALEELERGMGYQIVITLRPVTSALTAHGAGASAGVASM